MRILQKRAQARPDCLHVAVSWRRRRLSIAHLTCYPKCYLYSLPTLLASASSLLLEFSYVSNPRFACQGRAAAMCKVPKGL